MRVVDDEWDKSRASGAALKLLLSLSCALALAACAGEKEIEPDLKHPHPSAVGVRDPKLELDALLKRIARGELPRVEFDPNSAELRLNGTPTLDTIADLLIREPALKVLVVARADFFGGDDYNLELSKRRAKAVTAYLSSRGVPPISLRWRGLGRSQPLADNATEEGREKNRSVEFRFSTRDWEASW